MASIPANVILIWTGTNATIPSGWSRETTLDGRFPKGAAASTQGGTNGGAATHTHTSPTHSHTLNAHTHTYTLTSAGFTSQGSNPGQNNSAIIDTHTHTGTSGAANGGTTGTTAVTYGSVSNDPPNRAVIFIKASAGAALATNIVALYNSNTPPSNWSNVTELSGRFMKGAGTGADGDLTTDSGSSTNVHSINHSHTSNTHTHDAANSNAGSGTTSGSGNDNKPDANHVHSVSMQAGTSTIPDYSGSLTTTETVEPAYAILQAIQKGASGIKAVGLIGLWLETIASIPRGWVLCDGTNSTKDLREKHIKIGDPAGANGGSNTHTHASQSHTHSNPAAHNHTATVPSHVAGGGDTDANANHCTIAGSTHPATVNTTVAAYAAANTTADSSSNEPLYRTVNFIEYQKPIDGGSFLYNLI